MSKIQTYINEIISKYGTGKAREHAYRPALATLLESLTQNIIAINESSLQDTGIIDFEIKKKSVPIGYVEAKDIGINRLDDLDDREKKQFTKYLPLGNLCYTDYLEFRFYMNNESKPYETIRIADFDGHKIIPIPDQFDRLEHALKAFYANPATTIKSSKSLAEIMADKARMIADVAEITLNDKTDGSLHELFEAFKKMLVKDTDEKKFADFFAQTIAYGMFVARLNDKTTETFTRAEAASLIPRTMPFLRRMFDYVAGNEIDQRIVPIVDNLADAFAHTNIAEIMKNFGRATQTTDPILHFYETFLAKFDPKTRMDLGVFYTPQPVVDYIVRAVDSILKNDFGLADGLADKSKVSVKMEVQGAGNVKQEVHRVQVLDPATGTGTFLAQVIRQIAEAKAKNSGMWANYVENDLLPRMHGFEILMASYAMAHLKLDLVLRETGYRQTDAPIDEQLVRRDDLFDKYGERAAKANVRNSENRLSVFLTNSLEEADPDTPNLFGAQWLTAEAKEANRIKRDLPIMCVIGNPPYSGESQNKSPFIMDLMNAYKKESTGEKLKERNSKWINNDYVKFLRLAEHYVEKNESGIVGFITSNSYLDGPIFRGVRWHLLNTFDDIYILNLHGDTDEVIPKNVKLDKNIFDITEGVAIVLLVKKTSRTNKKLADVFYADLYGERKHKNDFLDNHSLNDIDFKKLKLTEPNHFFVPKDMKAQSEFEKGFSLTELFPLASPGIVTARDNLVIHYTKDEVRDTLTDFADLPPETARDKYKLGKDARDWTVIGAQNDLRNTGLDDNKIVPISFRALDTRYTYYTGNSKGVQCMARARAMCHLTGHDNISLIAKRGFPNDAPMGFVSKNISDFRYWSCSGMDGGDYVFPLYTYGNLNGKEPNLDTRVVNKIEKVVSKTTPEQILNYIYAILHSPAYRKKFKEQLKTEFPRIPYPTDKKEFMRLTTIGEKLINLHLMQKVPQSPVSFPISGTDKIEKISFQTSDQNPSVGRAYINNTQYFDNIPLTAWEFFIGGYQPAQKYLKDRRGRKLTDDECEHYEMIISVLMVTAEITGNIDK